MIKGLAKPAQALALRPREALATVESVGDSNPLLTREDRLRWLRDFASGRMTFTKYVRGMLSQVTADPPLRLRAVETLARMEGDIKDVTQVNVDKCVLVLPSNGRERVIDEESEEPSE